MDFAGKADLFLQGCAGRDRSPTLRWCHRAKPPTPPLDLLDFSGPGSSAPVSPAGRSRSCRRTNGGDKPQRSPIPAVHEALHIPQRRRDVQQMESVSVSSGQIDGPKLHSWPPPPFLILEWSEMNRPPSRAAALARTSVSSSQWAAMGRQVWAKISSSASCSSTNRSPVEDPMKILIPQARASSRSQAVFCPVAPAKNP